MIPVVGPCVYFWIADRDQGDRLMKIGSTTNLQSRHRQILTMTPYDCMQIWVLRHPGHHYQHVERDLHRIFKGFHKTREWFLVPFEQWREFRSKWAPVFFENATMEVVLANDPEALRRKRA